MKADLLKFENRLMNGLLFCKRTYGLFHKIRNGPNGKCRLRLRKGKLEKKLIEELIPIARYIQSRFHQGRQLKVRWIDGIQSYDAKIYVDDGIRRTKQYLEVTTVIHQNDHYRRKMIDEGLPTFGVKGIELRQNPKREVSIPHAYRNDEFQKDIARGITDIIIKKNAIDYPDDTILVIQCFLDRGYITRGEWLDTIDILENDPIRHNFFEVFVFESNGKYTHWL